MGLEKKQIYAEQFSRMLQVPTVTDVGDEVFAELHKVMQEIAPTFFEKLQLIKPRKNALIFKWEGKKHDRPLVLMGHQDVVPEGQVDKWKYPPYSGAIAEDRIWGRGAVDCKSTVFASMVAANELLEEGFVPEQDIYFCYGDDEENHGGGAAAEADWFLKEGIKPVLILDEGGGMMQKEKMDPSLGKFISKSLGVVGVCEKGFADLKFYARCSGGHSSTPPKNTPFVRLSKFVLYCEKHQIFERKVLPLVKEMLAEFSKAVKPVLRPLVKRAYIFAPLVGKIVPSLGPQLDAFLQTTMVFTMAEGAQASNNIPDAAYMLANLRYSPIEGFDKCLPKLEKVAKKWDITIEVDNTRDASPIADTKTAEYKYFCSAVNKSYGEVVLAPYLICGGTDCREMQRVCPTALRFTPFLISMDEMHRCHGYDECIPVESLALGVNFFRNMIHDFT